MIKDVVYEREIDDSEPEQDEEIAGENRQIPRVECVIGDKSPEELRLIHP